MHDYGETREELISMIMSDFEFCWKDLVINKEGSPLSKGAKDLKDRLEDYFEESK
jgi:hypothetical protein